MTVRTDTPREDPQKIVFRVNQPGPDHPQAVFDDALIAEFRYLLELLDTHHINRVEWERLMCIMVLATLEANDAERGRSAYDLSVQKWRQSEGYDGHD
jgi:hypothetical protein